MSQAFSYDTTEPVIETVRRYRELQDQMQSAGTHAERQAVSQKMTVLAIAAMPQLCDQLEALLECSK